MSDDLTLVRRLRELNTFEWHARPATVKEICFAAADRIEQLEAIMRKLVEPFKASKPLFGEQHLRSVRVGDQVVEELLAALEGKDD